MNFSLTQPGNQIERTDSSYVGNHVACVNNGLIAAFDGKNFTEYLIEIDNNNYISSDDE